MKVCARHGLHAISDEEAEMAPRCQDCGMADPPADQTCDGGDGGLLRDHYVGGDAGCPFCGRLMAACARRPCSEMRGVT